MYGQALLSLAVRSKVDWNHLHYKAEAYTPVPRYNTCYKLRAMNNVRIRTVSLCAMFVAKLGTVWMLRSLRGMGYLRY